MKASTSGSSAASSLEKRWAMQPLTISFWPGFFPQAALLVRVEDGVDGFLLRGVDEGAGIDDEDIGFVGIGGDVHAAAGGVAEHDLGIDEVLGAAEGDHADLHGRAVGLGAWKSFDFDGISGPTGTGWPSWVISTAAGSWTESRTCGRSI